MCVTRSSTEARLGGTGRNRDQVRDGARIMALLVPVFVEVIESNPEDIKWDPPGFSFVDETGSIL